MNLRDARRHRRLLVLAREASYLGKEEQVFPHRERRKEHVLLWTDPEFGPHVVEIVSDRISIDNAVANGGRGQSREHRYCSGLARAVVA